GPDPSSWSDEDMTATGNDTQCPAALLSEAVAVVAADDGEGLRRIEGLIDDYPADARLHFLRGSVLAGLRRYPEGRRAMRRALDIAPAYALARFQLGFLEFTSGEAALAEETWRPLHALADDIPLRLLAS